MTKFKRLNFPLFWWLVSSQEARQAFVLLVTVGGYVCAGCLGQVNEHFPRMKLGQIQGKSSRPSRHARDAISSFARHLETSLKKVNPIKDVVSNTWFCNICCKTFS